MARGDWVGLLGDERENGGGREEKGGGGDRDWGTGRWSLCVQRTEHSTLVFLGVGNEKGLCRLRFVSTQVRQGMPWHETLTQSG